MKRIIGFIFGSIVGWIVGYPLSYVFQPSILRSKLSLGGYISNIDKILAEGSPYAETAIITMLICAAVGGICGALSPNSK
jgi:hypothetical protein